MERDNSASYPWLPRGPCLGCGSACGTVYAQGEGILVGGMTIRGTVAARLPPPY